MMNEKEDMNKEKSKYNEAGLQISRLHLLWMKIENVTQHGKSNLEAWKFHLDSVWRELVADVQRKDDKENVIKKNDSLKKKIAMAQILSKITNKPSYLYN